MKGGGSCKVCVAQLGARRHYAVPRALYQAELLEGLVTDACAEILPWRWLDKILPVQHRPDAVRRLLGRRVPDIPAALIKGFPMFAMSARLDRRKGETQTGYWARRNARFCRLVVHAGFGSAGMVYAFNGAALEIFEAAKEKGLKTILDQTAAPWRWNARLLREEAELWPGWEEHPAEIDEIGALSEREEGEWKLADRIICGSDFAVEALVESGGPADRCSTVPYPGPVVERAKSAYFSRNRRPGEPFRVLFVGTLQLRKGVQYLLEAKKMLKGENITFRLVGPSLLSERIMKELRTEMEVVGAVPRAEVGKHYAWADAFVLPTLSEGSANVVYEAMAAGLPVITTPNAGSIIKDGVNGLLVPIRDSGEVARAISRLYDSDELCKKMGNASALNITGFNLENYAKKLVENLRCSNVC